MENGFIDIELGSPLEIDGAKIKALRMREPTVADQLAASEMSGSAAKQEITLMANLCEVTPDDIKRLKLRDYRKLQEAFAVFTEAE